MSAQSLLMQFFWLASTALLAVVAKVMYRRGLNRDYPMFFWYAIWLGVVSPSLFVLDHGASVTARGLYLFVDWLTALGTIALRFAISAEILMNLFRSYLSRKLWPRYVTSRGLLVLFAACLNVGTLSASFDHADWLVGTFLLLDHAVAIVQCALLIPIFGLFWFSKLSARSYLFGIALGFGLLSGTQIVVSALRDRAFAGDGSMNLVMRGVCLICVVTWALYLLHPEETDRRYP
jgi:hypothetical protein